jgi:hypothetical protein
LKTFSGLKKLPLKEHQRKLCWRKTIVSLVTGCW